MGEDQRRYCRVQTQYTLKATTPSQATLEGVMENLCLRGALVRSQETELIKKDDTIAFEITVPDAPDGPCVIKGDATVVRVNPQKDFALYFTEIEAEGFTHLTRLLRVNYGFGDRIDKEIQIMLAEN